MVVIIGINRNTTQVVEGTGIVIQSIEDISLHVVVSVHTLVINTDSSLLHEG
jgi:hypothetical protein